MSNPPATQPAAAKPKRNPVERVIVWVVIVLGLALVGTEAWAHFSHSNALKQLNANVDSKKGENETALVEADVKRILGNKVPADRVETTSQKSKMKGYTAPRYERYVFPSLLKTRELYVFYGMGTEKEPAEVLYAGTSSEMPPTAAEMNPSPTPSAVPQAPGGMGASPIPGGSTPSTPGGGAGGRPRGRPTSEAASEEPSGPLVPAAEAENSPSEPTEKPEENKPE